MFYPLSNYAKLDIFGVATQISRSKAFSAHPSQPGQENRTRIGGIFFDRISVKEADGEVTKKHGCFHRIPFGVGVLALPHLLFAFFAHASEAAPSPCGTGKCESGYETPRSKEQNILSLRFALQTQTHRGGKGRGRKDITASPERKPSRHCNGISRRTAPSARCS